MDQTLFYIVAFISILGALGVILNKNPVHSALSLVGFLFIQAILFVLLKAYFLAAVQVLVYAGAIMVLFIYVVMIMKLNEDSMPKMRLRPFSVFLAGVFGSLLYFAFKQNPLSISKLEVEKVGSIDAIGDLLFSEYILPFEVISLLLVVAMVGAVVLNRRKG